MPLDPVIKCSVFDSFLQVSSCSFLHPPASWGICLLYLSFCQVFFLLKGNSSFPLSPGGGPRASSDCWGSLSNIARSLLDYMKLCEGTVVVKQNDINEPDIEKLFKTFCSLVALHSEVEHFSGPKMFILISTIMTWACSKPADPVSVYNRNLTCRSLCVCNIYLNL